MTRNFNVHLVQGPVRPTNFLATAAAEKEEYRWLNLVKAAIEKQAVDKDFLVCLPCKRSSCDHSTSSNPCPFASVHRKRLFDSHVTPLHGYHQSSSPVPEPRASTYPNSWPATLCNAQRDTVDVACSLRRGLLSHHVWRSTHRNGFTEGKIHYGKLEERKCYIRILYSEILAFTL